MGDAWNRFSAIELAADERGGWTFSKPHCYRAERLVEGSSLRIHDLYADLLGSRPVLPAVADRKSRRRAQPAALSDGAFALNAIEMASGDHQVSVPQRIASARLPGGGVYA